MTPLVRHHRYVVIYWLISAVAIVVMWNSLPSVTAQVGLLALFAVIVLATIYRFMELPLVATVFFSILLVNDWLVNGHGRPLIGTVILFLILPAIGLLSEIIGYEELQIRRIYWAILGLLVAQINSLFYYWPVSFFNRSLLTGLVFYALWQLLRIDEPNAKRSYIAHFIFVGLAVMVVLGILLWANFPQLTAF